ncbi:RNA polymerase sigma factor [Pedococcus bigeumensis]|uniref:RNA polymerase sigma factor n=1 Tax=Pedococcus bigeumensis TaxID=433644 RepID=A0A502D5W7_9MICO|nr:RNA polymerase sigma factor [Pedococcus bigeumensis]TPG19391.1 RNA polymerase sigma factor [Pedococcus bigeumensis]
MSSPEERFSALFERTHVALLGYAVRRVADPADAADVVAETFLVAWRRLEDVPVGEQARPWLFGVARRVLANHYRGERRRVALADRLRDSLHEAVQPLEVREATAVERALDRLPDDDRELLRLLAWEELAREEIAVAMGLTRGAVRVRLHRARTKLKQAMEDIDRETDRVAVKRSSSTGHDSGRWALARRDPREEIS